MKTPEDLSQSFLKEAEFQKKQQGKDQTKGVKQPVLWKTEIQYDKNFS